MEFKNYFSELFLIIGGFILAETIVKKFLEMSNNQVTWWLLPLIALVLISGGIQLREKKKIPGISIIYWGWMIAMLIVIVFIKKGMLTLSPIIMYLLSIITFVFVVAFPFLYIIANINKKK